MLSTISGEDVMEIYTSMYRRAVFATFDLAPRLRPGVFSIVANSLWVSMEVCVCAQVCKLSCGLMVGDLCCWRNFTAALVFSGRKASEG